MWSRVINLLNEFWEKTKEHKQKGRRVKEAFITRDKKCVIISAYHHRKMSPRPSLTFRGESYPEGKHNRVKRDKYEGEKKNSTKPEVTFRPLLSGMFNPIMWPNLLPDCFIPFLSFFSYASPPIFSYFPPRSLLPSSFSVPSSPFLCYFWSKCCSGDLRWAAHIGKTLWGGCIE